MSISIDIEKIKYYAKCTINILGSIFMIFHTIITPVVALVIGSLISDFAEFHKMQYPKESVIAFIFLAFLFFQNFPEKQKGLFKGLVYINIFPGIALVVVMLSDTRHFGLNGLFLIAIQIGLYAIYWNKFYKKKEKRSYQ
ncbi:hypothetical protein CLTEP_09430 [Clostridium tepidiprofundi DSM 19306]|uniref:Uncharacterized protein n=1 Tax=Clostridium tepidiprofundi DSM 19306 TaxID=1121338 RepID=A0A151B5P3_9CLOT|nr:hypothetical protein [Clostridium tepidiprofundi]KYH35123.1 hypothetical protein CLTEP_09430 [Clostridium tepidiprofundi DSM 19306]